MSYKSLLLHLANDEFNGMRLDLGLALAQRFDAHLSALYIATPVDMPAAIEGRGASFTYIAEATEAARAKADSLHAEIEARAGAANLSWEWAMEEGDHLSLLTRRSYFADLAIVGRTPSENLEDSLFHLLPEHLPLASGCPTLVVPGMSEPKVPGKRILLGWKPSRECARALRDSLPFLEQADKVTVLSVCEPKPDHEVDESIGEYLARHGVRYQLLNHMAHEDEVGQIILRTAEEFGCDMICVGSYGHSRLRELMLGGVTRHILRHTAIPVLMSH